MLTDAAWSFHRHQVEFPGDPVVVWTWDKDRKVPAPRPLRRTEAEELFGKRLAGEALKLQPQDQAAQVALTSLSLEKAIERVGFTSFPAGEEAAVKSAIAAGPTVLAEVLRTAIADGKTELAAAAATTLGQVTDPSALSTRRPSASPGRGPVVARRPPPVRRRQGSGGHGPDPALPRLEPGRPHPGPVRDRPEPAPGRGHRRQPDPRQQARRLSSGRWATRPSWRLTGDQGFQAAAETADVELVLVSHDLFRGAWGLTDTLTNLKGDARTAKLPVYRLRPAQPRDHPAQPADETSRGSSSWSSRSTRPRWRSCWAAGRRSSPMPSGPATPRRRRRFWPGSPRSPRAPSPPTWLPPSRPWPPP